VLLTRAAEPGQRVEAELMLGQYGEEVTLPPACAGC